VRRGLKEKGGTTVKGRKERSSSGDAYIPTRTLESGTEFVHGESRLFAGGRTKFTGATATKQGPGRRRELGKDIGGKPFPGGDWSR